MKKSKKAPTKENKTKTVPTTRKTGFVGAITSYFTMQKLPFLLIANIFLFGIFVGALGMYILKNPVRQSLVLPEITTTQETYWLLLKRSLNTEILYQGVPGDPDRSKVIRTFDVKPGIPSERPTPLPQLLGRTYWKITKKMETQDNPETAPYFLELDVPIKMEEPFGPDFYPECEGDCNWVLPGSFGLHGVNGDESKLSKEDPGSSGCIRHTDEDITYLYNLLNPEKEEIRYYIDA